MTDDIEKSIIIGLPTKAVLAKWLDSRVDKKVNRVEADAKLQNTTCNSRGRKDLPKNNTTVNVGVEKTFLQILCCYSFSLSFKTLIFFSRPNFSSAFSASFSLKALDFDSRDAPGTCKEGFAMLEEGELLLRSLKTLYEETTELF